MKIKRFFKYKFVAVLISSALIGCATVSNTKQTTDSDYTLQILHFSDIDGNEEIALKSVNNFSALINGFSNLKEYKDSTIILSTGDNFIPGRRYFISETDSIKAITGSNLPGNFDISLLNYFNITASAVGNHELDAGMESFFRILKKNGTYSGAKFPYISSNIDFSTDKASSGFIGKNGEDASNLKGKVATYTKTVINGETIGLIGAVTPFLKDITSAGNITVHPKSLNQNSINKDIDFVALAKIIQQYIDELKNENVNKIILMCHMQQIDIEKKLATYLKDVDIIIAGGSNTRMGDENDSLFPGDESFAENYPFIAKDKVNNPVIIVNVDADYKYLGRLVVKFNKNGEIKFDELNNKINGVYASTDENVKNLKASPIEEVVTLQKVMSNEIKKQYENIVGYTNVYLDGRRLKVRREESNLGNLVTDAYLNYAKNQYRNTDFAYINGGAIRSEIGSSVIPAGSVNESDTIFSPPKNNVISEGDIRSSFPFNNRLAIISAKGYEVKNIFEDSIAELSATSSPGSFPQVSGVVLEFDESKNKGEKIISLKIGENIVFNNGVYDSINKNKIFEFVTSEYVAKGKENSSIKKLENPNIKFLADENSENKFNTIGREQNTIAEYVRTNYGNKNIAYNKSETPCGKDTRIINLHCKVK